MHYYKFNIADWHLATSHLTLEEEAIYFRLVNFYYDTEQSIPQETQTVIRRLRLGKHSDIVISILSEFFVLQEDGWHHLRCDDEIQKYHHKAEINQKVGKLGGRPKKINDLDNNPQKTQTVSKNNPQKTLTTNHKPLTTNHINTTPDGFDLFWDSYDKKVGKPNAIKEWKKINPNKELIAEIISQAKKDKQAKSDNKYRKDPERWLKGGHWQDELIVEHTIQKNQDLPLGTDQQIAHAYKVECGGDPTQSRFNSYFEMRKYILDQRDKRKVA